MVPPVVDIVKMDLWNFVQFTCDAQHTLTSVTYESGVLTVVTDFSTDLEGK